MLNNSALCKAMPVFNSFKQVLVDLILCYVFTTSLCMLKHNDRGNLWKGTQVLLI